MRSIKSVGLSVASPNYNSFQKLALVSRQRSLFYRAEHAWWQRTNQNMTTTAAPISFSFNFAATGPCSASVVLLHLFSKLPPSSPLVVDSVLTQCLLNWPAAANRPLELSSGRRRVCVCVCCLLSRRVRVALSARVSFFFVISSSNFFFSRSRPRSVKTSPKSISIFVFRLFNHSLDSLSLEINSFLSLSHPLTLNTKGATNKLATFSAVHFWRLSVRKFVICESLAHSSVSPPFVLGVWQIKFYKSSKVNGIRSGFPICVFLKNKVVLHLILFFPSADRVFSVLVFSLLLVLPSQSTFFHYNCFSLSLFLSPSLLSFWSQSIVSVVAWNRLQESLVAPSWLQNKIELLPILVDRNLRLFSSRQPLKKKCLSLYVRLFHRFFRNSIFRFATFLHLFTLILFKILSVALHLIFPFRASSLAPTHHPLDSSWSSKQAGQPVCHPSVRKGSTSNFWSSFQNSSHNSSSCSIGEIDRYFTLRFKWCVVFHPVFDWNASGTLECKEETII